MDLDWEKLLRRYVWHGEKTPYGTRVPALSARQARHELFACAVFTGALFGVLALATLAPGLPHGDARIVPLYAFSVCCAAAVLGTTCHPWAALWCALAPVGLLAYFALWGFHPALETADKVLLLAVVIAWLAYGRRLVAVARHSQRLAGRA